MDFGEAERLLREAEFLDCRPLWYSSNYVYLAQLCADGQQFAAVYKPRKGESPLWDFPEGTLCQREVAAYEFSRLLGWPLVPPTVLRDGPQGIGSVQVYIAHDPEHHYLAQQGIEELWPQHQRMCVFDALANNADRKAGHCLLDPRGQLGGMDLGLFSLPLFKLRSVLWGGGGEPIDRDLLDDVEQAALEIAAESAAAAPLLALIGDYEAGALLARMERLLRDGKFPLPDPGRRNHPWPVI